MEIVRIGDAPPEPLPRGERPPAGVRVLDLTRVLAGRPARGRSPSMAQMSSRSPRRTCPIPARSNWTPASASCPRILDLRNQQDVETLRTLVRGADVFSQSYRPGAHTSRGFSPEALAEMCPGIVSFELRAWGREGLWRERRGFDTIVQTATGMALVSGGGMERVARAHCWFNDLVSGRCGSMVEIAKRNGVGKQYVSRLIRLAFLSPEMVERIVAGRQPPELTAQALRTGRFDVPRRLLQGRVHHHADGPQRMIPGYSSLRRYVAEHSALLVVHSAHHRHLPCNPSYSTI